MEEMERGEVYDPGFYRRGTQIVFYLTGVGVGLVSWAKHTNEVIEKNFNQVYYEQLENAPKIVAAIDYVGKSEVMEKYQLGTLPVFIGLGLIGAFSAKKIVYAISDYVNNR